MIIKIRKSLVVCQGCQRLFHVEYFGARKDEISICSWAYQFCACREQLLALQSNCKSQCKNYGKRNTKAFEDGDCSGDASELSPGWWGSSGSVDMHLIHYPLVCIFCGPNKKLIIKNAFWMFQTMLLLSNVINKIVSWLS